MSKLIKTKKESNLVDEILAKVIKAYNEKYPLQVNMPVPASGDMADAYKAYRKRYEARREAALKQKVKKPRTNMTKKLEEINKKLDGLLEFSNEYRPTNPGDNYDFEEIYRKGPNSIKWDRWL